MSGENESTHAADAGRAVLIALIAAQFINAYDTSSMSVAMTNIANDLSTTLKSIQVAISTYSLVMAAGMITGSLITGITRLSEESQVVPPQLKTQIEQALQGDVSAVSNTQVQQLPALQGQPPEVVQAVVDINATARDEALDKALIVVGVLGLLGLGTSVLLPQRAVNPEAKSGQSGSGV